MKARICLTRLLPFLLLTAGFGLAIATGEARQQRPDRPLRGSAADRPHAADVVLVGFNADASSGAREGARQKTRARSSRRLSPRALHEEKWVLPAGQSLSETIDQLMQDPAVAYAEPDYVVQHLTTSNDTYYTSGSLWGMYGDATLPANQYGSQAGEAWAAGQTGSSNTFVGVIDEGIQFTHPDLAANVWTNPYNPVDGIDNDGNGYIDDVHGWDFYNNDASVYDSTADDHATHVAGTIGGQGGNNSGVVGVNWAVTMISAKFLGPSGGYSSDAIRALDYLTDLKVRHGLKIVASSNSWGGGGFSQALLDAINRSGDAGMLFVAAAGNAATNNDSAPFYPSSYQCTKGGTRGWDCVVSVASITNTGAISSFSNYGATTVDIGAPGSSIMSTVPTNSYASYSGTSMATPHVSGAIALCASMNATLSASSLRQAVLTSATATASLLGKTVTGGRLNVASMAQACLPPAGPQITTAALPDGTIGAAYAGSVAATGGATPYLWNIVSGLPSGLTLDQVTGAIAGIPSGPAGTAAFNVQVTDDDGLIATKALSIRVAAALQITTTSLPGGTVGTAYAQSVAATGGLPPYGWSLASGALPAGLSLNPTTGAISGTPTSGGTATFTARVVDAGAPQRSAQRALSIAIAAAATPGAFSKSAPASNATGQPRTLTLSWAASANAVSYSYCYDTSNNNSCSGTWRNTGTTRSATISGLSRNRNYYWQVRAANGSGTTTANGGTWWRFTTAP